MTFSLVTYNYQWLILQKHIKCVIYDKICEPLHFGYILGATLNTFKVTSITSIIMTSFVDNERSMTANVRCTTRPTCLVSPLGVGGGCVTLPRGGRSSVPRGGSRAATRSILPLRPVGTLTQHVADRIIRCIAWTSAVHTQHGRAWDADVSFS